MYSIDPAMSFGQVVCTYEDYIDETRKAGKKPVSFLRFLTGRYQKSDDQDGSAEATRSRPAFFIPKYAIEAAGGRFYVLP